MDVKVPKIAVKQSFLPCLNGNRSTFLFVSTKCYQCDIKITFILLPFNNCERILSTSDDETELFDLTSFWMITESFGKNKNT